MLLQFLWSCILILTSNMCTCIYVHTYVTCTYYLCACVCVCLHICMYIHVMTIRMYVHTYVYIVYIVISLSFSNYFVKLFYLNHHTIEGFDLTNTTLLLIPMNIPNCGQSCALDKFIE